MMKTDQGNLFLKKLHCSCRRICLAVGLLISLLLCSATVTQAQSLTTDPIATSSTVTAFVPDIVAPSTPILISPENQSLITSNQPTFVWQGVTDNYIMSHYQFYLDGNLVYDNLPLVSATNGDYTLVYDPLTNRYSLTGKTTISDGTHTWKISAVDAADNSTDSVTWSFTIDTQAPNFVVTKIGELEVSISAQDPNTVPTIPLVIETVSPLIIANGEANSQVEMTLSIPDRDSQVYTAKIDADGKWTMQLNNLPRGVVMYLDFVITDPAGHTSFLQDVPFMVKAEQTIIEIIEEIFGTVRPPTPTPTPIPEFTQEVPLEITPEVTPPVSVTPKPTEEIKPIEKLISVVPEIIFPRLTPGKRISFPYINLLVALIVPVISTLIISSRFGWNISPGKLTQIWRIFGYLPRERIQGMAFNSLTDEGISFAEISIFSQEDNSTYSDSVVSDERGFFGGLKFPAATYRLSVSHPDFRFPTHYDNSESLQSAYIYKSEFFEVAKTSKMPLLLVPLDVVSKNSQIPFLSRLRAWITKIARHPLRLNLILFCLTTLFSLLFPSVWNWLVAAIYLLLIIIRLLQRKQKNNLKILVTDQDKQLVPDTIVRLMPLGEISDNQENPFFGQIKLTDDYGTANFLIDESSQILLIKKAGYNWVEINRQRKAEKIRLKSNNQEHLVTIRPKQQTDKKNLINKNLPLNTSDCGIS